MTFKEYIRGLGSRIPISQSQIDHLSAEIERLESDLMKDGIRERKAFLAGDRKQEELYWRMGEEKKKEIQYLRRELRRQIQEKGISASTGGPSGAKKQRRSSELHQGQKCPCGCGGRPGRSCIRRQLKNKLASLERKIGEYKDAGYLPGLRKGLNTALDNRDKIKERLDALPPETGQSQP